MNQTKVTIVEKYSDSQGEHLVHRGTLVLIDSLIDADVLNASRSNSVELSFPNEVKWVNPIIISETEEIEKGDWVYHTSRMQLFKVAGFQHQMSKLIIPEDAYGLYDESIKVLVSDCVKVLALPEHFSDKHIRVIANGKMKNRDELLVKCNKEGKDFYYKGDMGRFPSRYEYFIDLNRQNHITLFPVKQEPKEHQPLSVKDAYGHIWNVGDEVTHSGVKEKETAIIESFYVDYEKGEIRANTTKGNAGLDYLTKVSTEQSLEEFAEEQANKKHPKDRRLTSYTAYKAGIKKGAEWAMKN